MLFNPNPQTLKKYFTYVVFILLINALVYVYIDYRNAMQSRQIEADKRAKEDRELLREILTSQKDLPETKKQIDSINNKLDTNLINEDYDNH